MKTNSRRTIRLYYGFQIFFSLLIWLPIFYEYQKHFGLSDKEIFSIQSFYYIAFCLLEIPTGLIADLWGYRKCMKAGAVVLVLTHLLPIFYPTYYGFLFHFFGIALSRSFISGASSAYLYDFLAEENRTHEFKQIEGQSRAYGLVIKVIAWATVGYLITWHITLPYWLTLVAAILSTIYAWRLPSLNKTNSPVMSGLALQKLQQTGLLIFQRIYETGQKLLHSPYLLFLMLQGVAIFVLSRIIQVNVFQPILSLKDIDLPWHGMIMSGMTIFEAIGSASPSSWRRYFSDRNSIFFITLLMALTILTIPYVGVWPTIISLCLFSLLCGWAYPIQRQLFNDAIPDSKYRATLMSIESIIDRAACSVMATSLAFIMSKPQGLNSFLIGSALATILVVVVLFLSLRFTRPVRGLFSRLRKTS